MSRLPPVHAFKAAVSHLHSAHSPMSLRCLSLHRIASRLPASTALYTAVIRRHASASTRTIMPIEESMRDKLEKEFTPSILTIRNEYVPWSNRSAMATCVLTLLGPSCPALRGMLIMPPWSRKEVEAERPVRALMNRQ